MTKSSLTLYTISELWLVHHSGVKRSILPLRDICLALGNKLVMCLPALHSVTLPVKLAAVKAIRIPENASMVLHFNSSPLTEGTLQLAETFLAKCLKPSTTFDDLRLVAALSKWISLALQLMQGNISNEHTTKCKCGYKPPSEMPQRL